MNRRFLRGRPAWHELAGAFGDVGTLLPLTLGLVIYNGVPPGRAFATLGLTYIFAGLFYKLPVPVQPLKATAMIAIATGATRAQIAAAALLISMAYLCQSLFVESFEGMVIGSSFESLFAQFAVDAFILVVGVTAGLAAGGLVRRSAASPANYVLCSGLTGLIAGFFGTLASTLINLAMEYYPLSRSGNFFWTSTAQVLYGSALLVMLAIAGGAYYSLWRGDARFLLPEPAEPVKQP
jgi:hypothetical protein